MIENLRDYCLPSGNVDLERLFLDVKSLIYHTCYEFKKRYNFGDIEDLVASANLRFLAVVDSYDETKASFSYWLRKKLWSYLFDSMKIQLHRMKSLPRTEYVFTDIPAKQFEFGTYKRELTTDAQIVLNLLVNGKCDNVRTVVDRVTNYRSPITVARVKKAIEKELVASWDWTRERVRSAFVEISNSLPT